MTQCEGGCRCQSIRYAIDGEALHTSICHCEDCRRSSGAPFVAWCGVKSDAVRLLKGKPKRWTVDGKALRYFCDNCGTGLYYINEDVLPGLVDIQVATLDNPDDWPPQLQVQVAEKLKWIDAAMRTSEYERYPHFSSGIDSADKPGNC